MPSIQINNSNIGTFSFTATFDLLGKRIILNTSSTTYNGSSGGGIFNCKISFFIKDQDSVVLTEIDFTDPTKYISPSVTQQFIIDLSSLNYVFFFQEFTIIGAIQDNTGTYQTTPVYAKLCEPINFNESGYVPGMFQIIANCPDNILTIKELTVFTYNNTLPDSKTKSGNLYYPTGTISPIAFTNTPFSNNIIYTGQYRINNDTTAIYTIVDGIFVQIVYRTSNQFDVTCANFIGDLMCCVLDLQYKAIKNCNNAIGKTANQQLAEIAIPFMIGLGMEINGQNASEQAKLIRKTLNCNCGVGSIGQNEMTPLNPSVTNIVLNGVGGTSIAGPTVVGSTKTFNIQSNIYQVTKGNTGDLAFTIDIDTATANTVKYKITFNYNIQAGYILTAIGNNPTLITQLNSLINFTNFNIDLTSLNGECVINLSSLNYFLSYKVASGADGFKNITINGTTYTPPSPIAVNSVGAIETYLNGLGLGTFEVNFSNSTTGAYFNILTTNNVNTVTGIVLTIGGGDVGVAFQKTNKSLIAVLQAIIDYLCGLTALQMALGNTLALCSIDYNGVVVQTSYDPDVKQSVYNAGIAATICNLANRIATLTTVTCTTLNSIFADNINASFAGALARVFGKNADGTCVGYTVDQFALGIFQAANIYPSVKAAFCNIDCTVPATCPDVAGIGLGMNGVNIGVYGLTWSNTPSATQSVTVSYKLTSSSTYIIATNNLQIFPSGSINGTTPFNITGVTPGSTYNVRVVNNCGGAGFVSQISVPTSGLVTDNYLISNSLYLICGTSPVQLYSSAVLGTGITIYTNAGLTIPLTGYVYIANSTNGEIFQINSITGLVGIDTGTVCATGTAGSYTLGNNTGTICAAAATTLYTNGAFGVGKILYIDSALTTPVTGYSFVVNSADGVIYNLNTSTGLIGTTTGLSCTAVNNPVRLASTTNSICAIGTTAAYTNGTFGVGKVLYSDAGLTTPITGFLFVSDGLNIWNLNSATGVVGSLLAQQCGQVLIQNGSSWGTVTSIGSLSGFTLNGTITPGGSQSGTHAAFNASIQMTLTGVGSGTAILRRNGVIISTKPSGPGTITFDFNNFIVGDVIVIQFN